MIHVFKISRFQSIREYCRVLQSIKEYHKVPQNTTKYYKDKSSASTWTNFWACWLSNSAEIFIYGQEQYPLKQCAQRLNGQPSWSKYRANLMHTFSSSVKCHQRDCCHNQRAPTWHHLDVDIEDFHWGEVRYRSSWVFIFAWVIDVNSFYWGNWIKKRNIKKGYKATFTVAQ